MNKQEILDAYKFRHACKEFDPKKIIPKDDFEFILETARLSPSSLGLEPWKFIIVQDTELREKLKQGAWGAVRKLETASHFLVCLTMKPEFMRFNSSYVRNFMRDIQKMPDDLAEKRVELIENFQKNDFDLNDDERLFQWASKQCYIALGNMLTSAAMIGIDSCPIEGFSIKTTEAVLEKEFGVDLQKYGISYMAAFGYRLNEPRTKTRRAIEDVVIWK